MIFLSLEGNAWTFDFSILWYLGVILSFNGLWSQLWNFIYMLIHSLQTCLLRVLVPVFHCLVSSWWNYPFLYCHFSIFLKFDIMLLHSSFFFLSSVIWLYLTMWAFFLCDVYCIVVKHLNHVMGALEINKWWLRGCIMSYFGFRLQVSSCGMLCI